MFSVYPGIFYFLFVEHNISGIRRGNFLKADKCSPGPKDELIRMLELEGQRSKVKIAMLSHHSHSCNILYILGHFKGISSNMV